MTAEDREVASEIGAIRIADELVIIRTAATEWKVAAMSGGFAGGNAEFWGAATLQGVKVEWRRRGQGICTLWSITACASPTWPGNPGNVKKPSS